MKTLLKITATCVLVSASALTFAIQNPTLFVSGLVTGLQKEVATKHLSLKSSPEKLYGIVQKSVMPDLAIKQMAGMTIGPRWRNATKLQRSDFVAQFSKLVTRNYSAALMKVSDFKFQIYPLRGKGWETDQQVIIRGAIVPKNGGQGSSVTYYLERQGDEWKIYDFAVEGISFVSNFRSQFASFNNIDDLISALKKLNERDA